MPAFGAQAPGSAFASACGSSSRPRRLGACHRQGDGPGRLLDLGAADGRCLRDLVQALGPCRAVGVECVPALVAEAARLSGGAQVLAGDAADLPVEVRSQTYDLVTALALLEFVDDPTAVLEQAQSVLEPGGLLVVTCPEPHWEELVTRVALRDAWRPRNHLDHRTLIGLVQRAGFELLAYERFLLAPLAASPLVWMDRGPALVRRADRAASRVRQLGWLFVNQCVVARKPGAPRQLA